jgi:integrase
MVGLRMTSLRRDRRNGDWFARKGIPADVRDAYHAMHGQGWEARFRISGSTPPSQAKHQFAVWLGTIEARIAAIRNGEAGALEQVEPDVVRQLASRWQVWFVQRNTDPGIPVNMIGWDHVLSEFGDAWRAIWPDPHPDDDPEDEPDPRPRALRLYRELVAEYGKVAQFLSDEGKALMPASKTELIDAIGDRFGEAVAQLVSPESSPPVEPVRPLSPIRGRTKLARRTCWQLFEEWVDRDRDRPAASTVNRWRAVFRNLEAHFQGRDIATITPDEAQAWANGLLTADRSSVTVNDIWISSARSVFGWATKQERRYITTNPFADVAVDRGRRVRLRESKAFTREEIKIILRATLQRPARRTGQPTIAARRWVPWLCAYTGARCGEITQLRREDVINEDGVWCLRITPEAGTVKTGQARIVPLHQHLVEQGFIEFVEGRPEGPLFCPPAANNGPVDPTNPPRPPSVVMRQRLGDWIRGLGVTDPEVSPTHSWRHTFKLRAVRHGMEERHADAICGHAPATVGRGYMTPELEDKVSAIRKFPRYEIG